jgi:DNA (cytosine-5)-methyltransferase 1
LHRQSHDKVLLGRMARNFSKFTVGCLFAAIGGFCRAFQGCGATVLWANEKDRFARDTFVVNFPGVRHIHKPVEMLSVEQDELEPVDILTAGFPCQPFSVAGEKLGLKDERGLLFLHIVRLLREFGKEKPKVLLLENVQHFRNHDKGKTFRRVQSEIQKAGYWFSDKDAQILNTATHTDIPQNRERIFMVAFSSDHFASNTYEFPKPLPDGSLRRVKEFLSLDTKADSSLYFKSDSQYHPMFVEAMANGGRDSVYQLRRSYVRENMSGMCFTLMANMGDGGHNIPVIKDRWGIRKLTPRECARLQGYEDEWFEIPPDLSRSQVCKQIGNSVTIPLVKRLAEGCIRALANDQKRPPKKVRKQIIRGVT